MTPPQSQASFSLLPEFQVRIPTPDLAPWLPGNIGVPGFTRLKGRKDGPHLVLLGLMHGNEIAGATVLDRLLRDWGKTGTRPLRGTLTIGFMNLAAFARFNPNEPTASRFVDEDLNRVWDEATLAGARTSVELARARQIRPLLKDIDMLVDLHSMLWPSDPLVLSGPTERGISLAYDIPTPELIVADHGHLGGKRLIDHSRFTHPESQAAAILVEAGQHWQPQTVALTELCVRGLMHKHELTTEIPEMPAPMAPRRLAKVTHVVTATTAQFAFIMPFRGSEVIARRNTLIALDGAAEIRTPYDNCMLIMPSLRPSRGHTAVRLAQVETIVGPD
jgi:hypothetical protein